MKRLYILRHAEAVQGTPDQRRPLSPAGRAAATAMGDVMRARDYLPRTILCSPAMRTRETLEGLSLDAPSPHFVDAMYQAGAADLMAVAQERGGRAESLLLVGHNPAVHGLALALAVRGAAAQMQSLRAGYAPGTLAVLEFEGAWDTLDEGAALLTDLVAPG